MHKNKFLLSKDADMKSFGQKLITKFYNVSKFHKKNSQPKLWRATFVAFFGSPSLLNYGYYFGSPSLLNYGYYFGSPWLLNYGYYFGSPWLLNYGYYFGRMAETSICWVSQFIYNSFIQTTLLCVLLYDTRITYIMITMIIYNVCNI